MFYTVVEGWNGVEMNNKEYGKVIAKNLKRIAYEHGKTQSDIVRDLHINQGTVSSWMVGTRIPRMDKIDMLCNYFNVSRTEIMEEEPTNVMETITAEERELLRLFRQLNVTGQTESIRRISEMTLLQIYTDKKEESSTSHIA